MVSLNQPTSLDHITCYNDQYYYALEDLQENGRRPASVRDVWRQDVQVGEWTTDLDDHLHLRQREVCTVDSVRYDPDGSFTFVLDDPLLRTLHSGRVLSGGGALPIPRDSAAGRTLRFASTDRQHFTEYLTEDEVLAGERPAAQALQFLLGACDDPLRAAYLISGLSRLVWQYSGNMRAMRITLDDAPTGSSVARPITARGLVTPGKWQTRAELYATHDLNRKTWVVGMPVR